MRFLQGRNGTDQLNIALLVASLCLALAERFLSIWILGAFTYTVLFIALFRTFSRNIPKRRAENSKFLRKTAKIRARIAKIRSMDHRQYRYFRCKNCKQGLRAPRGRGNIQVTCTKCGTVFRKRV